MAEDEDKTIVISGDRVTGSMERILCTECGIALEPAADRPDFFRCPRCGRVRFRPPVAVGPGSVIGGYRVLKILPGGGMSRLYLCDSSAADPAQRFVLKMLAGDRGGMVARRRFLREGKLCRKLNHPNIVKVYEAASRGNEDFIVMEYITGHNLEQLVRADMEFPEDVCVEIIRRVAGALAYAWNEFQLLHRDIKPSNIMIDSTGEVKLLDFGIAKQAGDSGTTILTMAGQSLGTPRFMSPEQFKDSGSVDPRSDIYSLGATLYFILSGSYPVPGDSCTDVYENLRRGNVVPLRQRCPDLSPGCVELVRLMMENDPSHRPGGWAELTACIEEVRCGRVPALPSA